MAPTHNLLFGSIGGSVETFLVQVLTEQGYAVELVEGLDDLLLQLDRQIDLLLLNVVNPQDLSAVSAVRERSTCAIIVIGPPRSAPMLITALERGADDYVQRPFRTDELLARIRARLRRIGHGELPIMELGPLRIDLRTRRAMLNNQLIDLTSFEFMLLAALATHPGQKHRAAQLLEQVWGARRAQDVELLQSTIHHLRTIIEIDPGSPTILCGDVRAGYWLSAQLRAL